MILSTKQIKEYMDCPLKYKFKYIDEIPYEETDSEYYNSKMKNIMLSYFTSLLDNQVIPLHTFKSKYSSIIYQMSHNAAFIDSPIIKKSKTTADVAAIVSYYEWASQYKPKDIIAIGKEYAINIAGINVYGTIDVVNRTPGIISIKAWDSSDDFYIKTDIEEYLNAIAFRHIYGKYPKEHIVRTKNGKIYVLNKEESELERAVHILENVNTCIKNEIFYPRWNITCKKCCYQPICLNWK